MQKLEDGWLAKGVVMNVLGQKFAARFGNEVFSAVVDAAFAHVGQDLPFGKVEDGRIGSDSFRYALLVAIGFECVSRPEFMKHHGINVDPDELKAWVVENAELETFDGDHPDTLSLFAGAYGSWYSKDEA